MLKNSVACEMDGVFLTRAHLYLPLGENDIQTNLKIKICKNDLINKSFIIIL